MDHRRDCDSTLTASPSVDVFYAPIWDAKSQDVVVQVRWLVSLRGQAFTPCNRPAHVLFHRLRDGSYCALPLPFLDTGDEESDRVFGFVNLTSPRKKALSVSWSFSAMRQDLHWTSYWEVQQGEFVELCRFESGHEGTGTSWQSDTRSHVSVAGSTFPRRLHVTTDTWGTSPTPEREPEAQDEDGGAVERPDDQPGNEVSTSSESADFCYQKSDSGFFVYEPCAAPAE